MRQVPEKLQSIVENAVSAMGYELVGVEYLASSGSGLLRVYIDTEQGITLKDCEAVSHQLSGVLDVEDPISGNYQLEISSPGLDRPLFKAADFQRFSGQQVRMKLVRAIDGRRKFTGVLKGMQDDTVVVETDGQEVHLPMASIDQARLVPDI